MYIYTHTHTHKQTKKQKHTDTHIIEMRLLLILGVCELLVLPLLTPAVVAVECAPGFEAKGVGCMIAVQEREHIYTPQVKICIGNLSNVSNIM